LQILNARFGQLAHIPGGDPFARLHHHLIAHPDIEAGGFTLQAFGLQIQREQFIFIIAPDRVGLEEDVENLLIDAAGVGIIRIGIIKQCPQQDADGQFAPAVNAGVNDVFNVEFKSSQEPR
jgi:hypothetical protein